MGQAIAKCCSKKLERRNCAQTTIDCYVPDD